MWQCGHVIDLLCEKYQRLLQRYVCRRLLRLRPTLLQWDLQRVLRRYRLHAWQHLRQQSPLCLWEWLRMHRDRYLYRGLVLSQRSGVRHYLLLQCSDVQQRHMLYRKRRLMHERRRLLLQQLRQHDHDLRQLHPERRLRLRYR
jgi:hypothetical protein